jgi:hypothetical protein
VSSKVELGTKEQVRWEGSKNQQNGLADFRDRSGRTGERTQESPTKEPSSSSRRTERKLLN